MPHAAVEAFGVGRIAVNLDNLVIRHTGFLMQIVDILRDDRGHLSALYKICNGVMARIRGRADPARRAIEHARPGFAALVAGSNEVLIINRLHLAPDAARAAEIGNPAFR